MCSGRSRAWMPSTSITTFRAKHFVARRNGTRQGSDWAEDVWSTTYLKRRATIPLPHSTTKTQSSRKSKKLILPPSTKASSRPQSASRPTSKLQSARPQSRRRKAASSNRSRTRSPRRRRGYETGAQLLQRILETRRNQWFIPGRGQGKGKYKEPAAPDTADLPELSAGWVWTNVDQLAEVGTGATPKRDQARYFGGDIPWVTSAAVNDTFVDHADEFDNRCMPWLKTNLSLYPPGTLLVDRCTARGRRAANVPSYELQQLRIRRSRPCVPTRTSGHI